MINIDLMTEGNAIKIVGTEEDIKELGKMCLKSVYQGGFTNQFFIDTENKKGLEIVIGVKDSD